MKRLARLALAGLLGAVATTACGLEHRLRPEPPPLGATRALAQARTLQRERSDGWRPRALAAARSAVALAPDWIAPRRLLDDLERERLAGPEALGQRLEELAAAPGDPALLYLVGRLEGSAGLARHEAACARAPELSWPHHGVAWSLFLDGKPRRALHEGQRALECARGSYELGTFSIAEARYWLALESPDEAVELLEDTLSDPRLEDPERTECRVWLARSELALEERVDRERGFWRGVDLLQDPRLTRQEREDLGADLLDAVARIAHPDGRAVLESALAPGLPGSEGLRARLWLERGAGELATALLADSADEDAAVRALARFQALQRGDARAAIEPWRAELPFSVVAPDGLPRETALRALCLVAQAEPSPQQAADFGEALLLAGWFGEAQAWASALARSDAARAFDLDRRASAGRALLAGVRGVLLAVDADEPVLAPGAGRASRIGSLEELLAVLQPYFDRYHAATDGRSAQDLVGSPRLVEGALATVVHPGPLFSAEDERAGRGTRGEPVPGLAAELAHIGRFGLFGQAPGGDGPDGAILRLLGTEWRAGAHLGVPFEGLVAWCDGSDLESRPGRRGSPVSGAALHEGYWIDVAGVRRDLERTQHLEHEYLDEAPDELADLLDGRGPRLAPGADADERARWTAPLGEGERVLLAVLRERAAAGRESGKRIELGELLALTATHEEGHLTDRTRFLPLTRHWLRALGLLLHAGLSPRAVARELEYRAQLVALCDAEDPRLVLAETLSAADETDGLLPHGEAYRGLLEDLLAIAARRADEFPELDPEHGILHQMHFLGAEQVRSLARELAQRNGMVE